MSRLFHLVPEDAWSVRLTLPSASRESYAPPSLSVEGFVHLSFAHQVEGTLETHFADRERVYLIEVDAARVEPDLKLEVSRGGAPFPHLYRPLAAVDLLRAWLLARREHWSVPRLSATDAARDVPEGRLDLV